MAEPDRWRGFWVGGPTGYLRMVASRFLVSSDMPVRRYAVAVHVFDGAYQGSMHEHRWPIAVYPFGEGAPRGTVLYEMPWESQESTGWVTVKSHQPYALESPSTRHAVWPVRPHMSVVLTDVTDEPTLPNGLPSSGVDGHVVREALRRAVVAYMG